MFTIQNPWGYIQLYAAYTPIYVACIPVDAPYIPVYQACFRKHTAASLT